MKKYVLTFVCESNGERETEGYDVTFSYDPKQYGNGTYMSCRNHKKGYYSPMYDIRYDRDYSSDRQVQYIMDWVLNTWNGENGSYRATEITIKEVEDQD